MMLTCNLISAKNRKVYSELKSVILPGNDGQIQILPQHAETFLIASQGELILEQNDNQKKIITISGGEIHIKDNIINIIL